jgi:hypothetical protein
VAAKITKQINSRKTLLIISPSGNSLQTGRGRKHPNTPCLFSNSHSATSQPHGSKLKPYPFSNFARSRASRVPKLNGASEQEAYAFDSQAEED